MNDFEAIASRIKHKVEQHGGVCSVVRHKKNIVIGHRFEETGLKAQETGVKIWVMLRYVMIEVVENGYWYYYGLIPKFTTDIDSVVDEYIKTLSWSDAQYDELVKAHIDAWKKEQDEN